MQDKPRPCSRRESFMAHDAFMHENSRPCSRRESFVARDTCMQNATCSRQASLETKEPFMQETSIARRASLQVRDPFKQDSHPRRTSFETSDPFKKQPQAPFTSQSQNPSKRSIPRRASFVSQDSLNRVAEFVHRSRRHSFGFSDLEPIPDLKPPACPAWELGNPYRKPCQPVLPAGGPRGSRKSSVITKMPVPVSSTAAPRRMRHTAFFSGARPVV